MYPFAVGIAFIPKAPWINAFSSTPFVTSALAALIVELFNTI
jgi:hypothetical protein